MELSKLENIKIVDLYYSQYPDFEDAFIIYAQYKGRALTDDELDELNENTHFVNEYIHDNFPLIF